MRMIMAAASAIVLAACTSTQPASGTNNTPVTAATEASGQVPTEEQGPGGATVVY
jgi:uncharacterized lipoprotein YmbA